MREYAICMAVAFLVTFLVTPVVRWAAIRFKAISAVRDRDVHTIPIPRLGGVGVYLGIVLAMFVAHQLPSLQTAFQGSSEINAVLIAGGFICLLGVLDDKYDIDALTKFTGQVACAGLMVLLGVQLAFIYLPFGGIGTVSLDPNTAFLATTLLILITVNAMNFIDGLDGLLAGVAVIAALGFFAYSYNLSLKGYNTVVSAPALLTAVLAGACFGFLVHNFNPARIFLGDSGSMLIGLVLAAAATSSTSHSDVQSFTGGKNVFAITLPVILPLAVLAVPMIDMVLAVVRRARKGQSPFTPDKAHLHHRLLEIGHTQRRAVMIMYIWSALIAFAGVGLVVTTPTNVIIGVAVLLVLAVIVSVGPRLRASRRGHQTPVTKASLS